MKNVDDAKDYGFCLRCGRRLRTKEARQKGYGAVCEKKLKIDKQKRLFML